MIHRPFTITIVGAVLIGMGILHSWSVVSTLRIIANLGGWAGLISYEGALFFLLAARSAIELVAGFGILRGKNRARVLWTSWYILDIGLKIPLSIQTPLIQQAIHLAFILFLFLPQADAFFETD